MKKDIHWNVFFVVRKKRFELSQPFGRYHLKVVRLPISPPPHFRFTIDDFQLEWLQK